MKYLFGLPNVFDRPHCVISTGVPRALASPAVFAGAGRSGEISLCRYGPQRSVS